MLKIYFTSVNELLGAFQHKKGKKCESDICQPKLMYAPMYTKPVAICPHLLVLLFLGEKDLELSEHLKNLK